VIVKDFFVSFTGADRQWASWISWELAQAGLEVTFQDWDFGPSTNFVLEMDKALKTCKRVLLVLSSRFFESRFVAAEWSSAFASDPSGEKGRLLPVRVEACEIAGLLGPIVYVDLVGVPEDAARELLLQAALQRSRRPAQRPQFPGASNSSPHFPGNDRGDRGAFREQV
jgi:TIR domain